MTMTLMVMKMHTSYQVTSHIKILKVVSQASNRTPGSQNTARSSRTCWNRTRSLPVSQFRPWSYLTIPRERLLCHRRMTRRPTSHSLVCKHKSWPSRKRSEEARTNTSRSKSVVRTPQDSSLHAVTAMTASLGCVSLARSRGKGGKFKKRISGSTRCLGLMTTQWWLISSQTPSSLAVSLPTTWSLLLSSTTTHRSTTIFFGTSKREELLASHSLMQMEFSFQTSQSPEKWIPAWRTSLTRHSTVGREMRSSVSIDRARCSPSSQTSSIVISSRRSLIETWGRWNFSLIKHFASGAQARSCSSSRSTTNFHRKQSGSSTTQLTFVDSSTSSKATWGSRSRQTSWSTSTWSTQRHSSQLWRMSCITTCAVTRWWLVPRKDTLSPTNRMRGASTSTRESICITSGCVLMTASMRGLELWR